MLYLSLSVVLGIAIGWLWQPAWAAPFVAYSHSVFAKAISKSKK